MAKVSFNGVNREIIILPGIDSIDVQIDLYSEWKRWIQISDNAKYPAAFRTFGGDPTVINQFAPRYFFLINNWEIIATSVSVAIQTNLYSDNGDTGIVIDNAAVSVRNSDAAVVSSEYEQSLIYNGVVNINTRNLTSGVAFPFGTVAQPVNNLADAIVIANTYNISSFSVRGNMIFDQEIENAEFTGSEFPPILDFTDVDVSNCIFVQFQVTGTLKVSDNRYVQFTRCGIDNLFGFCGILENCVLMGDLGLCEVSQPKFLLLSNSVSGLSGEMYPTISIPSGTYSSTASGTASIEATTSNLNIRNYSGGIGLKGTFASGSFATFELDPGKVHLESSVEGGEIVIRGIGDYQNNLLETFNGTVNTNGFYYDIENSSQINSYNGIVIIDTDNGVTGSIFPVGTGALPVNNLEDALLIAGKYHIHKFMLDSDLTLTGDLSNLSFFGDKFPPNIYIDSATLSKSNFSRLSLSGTFSASSNSDQVLIEDSIIDDLDNFYGIIHNSSLSGTIQLGDSSNVTITDCKSLIAGTGSPVISKYNGSTSSVSFSLRSYSGGIKLKDWNNPSDVATLEFIAGRANIDPSCTDGLIVIRGVGSLGDLSGTSSNVTLITDGFTSNIDSHLERMDPELFRIGDTTDQTLTEVQNLSGGTSSDVYDLLQSVAGTVSLIYSDTQELVTDVDYLVTKLDEHSQLLVQIAGLSQKNYRIDGQIYDTNGCLTSASIKTYPTALDAENKTNPDHSYDMEADYDVDGRLIDYKVLEI